MVEEKTGTGGGGGGGGVGRRKGRGGRPDRFLAFVEYNVRHLYTPDVVGGRGGWGSGPGVVGGGGGGCVVG